MIKEHINTVINKILERFVGITIRYEFKQLAKTHLIEVTPSQKFYSDEFQNFSKDIIFEFYDKFPDFNFCFITEDSLAQIVHPEITKSSPAESALFSALIGEEINYMWKSVYVSAIKAHKVNVGDISSCMPKVNSHWDEVVSSFFLYNVDEKESITPIPSSSHDYANAA